MSRDTTPSSRCCLGSPDPLPGGFSDGEADRPRFSRWSAPGPPVVGWLPRSLVPIGRNQDARPCVDHHRIDSTRVWTRVCELDGDLDLGSREESNVIDLPQTWSVPV